MDERSFETYAEERGYGSLQLPGTGPDQDSYLIDLRLMAAQARGAAGVSAADRDHRFQLRSGITLQSEINGLAEIVDGVHYGSVTFGYCAASLYAAESLMGSDLLSECGAPGRRLDGDLDLLNPDALLADPGLLCAALIDRQTLDPERAAASRFISHVMFLFAFLHEFNHCALGHCLELEKRGAPARLREIGSEEAQAFIDLRMFHGFELQADSHACDGVMHVVLSGLDMPTQLGLIDAPAFAKCRLAVLAMSLSAALWHALDSRRTAADWQHPQPAVRLINLMNHVQAALTHRLDAATATDFNRQWLQDLREISFRSSTVHAAYCDLHRSYSESAMQTVLELHREHRTLSGRYHFPN